MIKIICIGKIKEDFYKKAIEEYVKRIGKYTKLEIVELKDYDKININDILKKEGASILKNIKDRDYVITMEIEGVKLDSIGLSEKINGIYNTNFNIVFVIGGSYGISDLMILDIRLFLILSSVRIESFFLEGLRSLNH